MDQKQNIINSCRVCRTPNEIEEFECLYVQEEFASDEEIYEISPLGKLYEELLEIRIEKDTMDFYPHYLCNSCELQMKLFKKLKMNALKTLATLEELYVSTKLKKEETFQLLAQDEKKQVEEDQVSSSQAENGANDLYLEEEYVEMDDLDNIEVKPETPEIPSEHHWPTANADAGDDMSEFIEVETRELEANEEERDNKDDNAITTEGDDNYCVDVLYLEEDEYVMEESLDDKHQEHEDENFEPNQIGERNKAYPCSTCMLEFKTQADFVHHKKKLHDNKYPCTECPRVLKTETALTTHMRRHRGLPLFQCEICHKTFNQKVHYIYHINRHNNVRNFKCEVCGKSYITKSDLNQHKRIHTGERPYACETCGKTFIILQHLKMHRYSHIGKTIECELCKLKFTAPSTLRMHMDTIHVSEPRYPCEFCSKRFRRKHHLEAHHKVHQKNKNETEEIDVNDIIGTLDDFSEEQIEGIIVVDDSQAMENIDSDSVLM